MNRRTLDAGIYVVITMALAFLSQVTGEDAKAFIGPCVVFWLKGATAALGAGALTLKAYLDNSSGRPVDKVDAPK